MSFFPGSLLTIEPAAELRRWWAEFRGGQTKGQICVCGVYAWLRELVMFPFFPSLRLLIDALPPLNCPVTRDCVQIKRKKKKKRKEEDNLQLRDYTSLTSCTARSQLTGSLSPGASKSLECVYFRATCAELSFVFDSGIFKLWHRQVLNGIEVPVLMGHPVRNELSAHVCAAWQVQMSWLTFPSGWGCWARHWIYN